MLGQPWTDRHGDSRAIGVEDVIVVAPYNAHVALVHGEIERRLAPGLQVRVGTVDKFQGQEGAIAIYSMASSSRDDAPRDMDFLYSRNRLNVAVSRARAIALVIASPRLLEAELPDAGADAARECTVPPGRGRGARRHRAWVELLTLGLV